MKEILGHAGEREFTGELPREILDAACLDFPFDPLALLDSLADVYRGVVEIEVVKSDPAAMEALAFLEVFPATGRSLRRTVLHMSQTVFDLAEAGDEDARALVAHEVGRIVQVNHEAMAG